MSFKDGMQALPPQVARPVRQGRAEAVQATICGPFHRATPQTLVSLKVHVVPNAGVTGPKDNVFQFRNLRDRC